MRLGVGLGFVVLVLVLGSPGSGVDLMVDLGFSGLGLWDCGALLEFAVGLT